MITLDLADYGEYRCSNIYIRTKGFEKLYNSKDNMIKLIHKDKACIIQYMEQSVDSCNKCCFQASSRCSSLIGISDCGDLPMTCGPGYFKTIDDIMEEL